MRVVAYNAHGLREGTWAARLVGKLRPDVVLVQEFGTSSRLNRFAGALDMRAAAARTNPLIRTTRNAVLVRGRARLAWREVTFRGTRPLRPRGALMVRVDGEGGRYLAASIHLGLHPEERARHAGAIARVLEGVDRPVIAGGDLNERPRGEAARVIGAGLIDAWRAAGRGRGLTYPSEAPGARIDYLFVSPGARVEQARVVEGADAGRASDHLPLLVEVELPEPVTYGVAGS